METKEQVIFIRKAFGISGEELGHLAGVIRQAVYRWQKGDTVPMPLKQSRLKQLLKAARAWEETGLSGSCVLTHHKLSGPYVSLFRILAQPLIDLDSMADAAVQLAKVPKEAAIPAIKKGDGQMKYKTGHVYNGFMVLEREPAKTLRHTRYKVMHIVDCGGIKWVTHGYMNTRKHEGAYARCSACERRKRDNSAVCGKAAIDEIPKDIGPMLKQIEFNPVAGNVYRTEMMRKCLA